MDPDWLVYHPNPSVPTFKLPQGAVDAHCHVFGPGNEFPFARERKYTPCDAGKEKLWALRDHLGFSRNVIVQATCHGADNSSMVDALLHSNGMARGVATVRASVTDEELQSLHAAGVRGVRFNFVKRLVNVTPEDQLRSIASRIAPLGWHLVIYFEAPDLDEYIDFFTSLPAPVVFDHMGRPDVTQAAGSDQFQKFVTMMRSNETLWTKDQSVVRPPTMTLYRLPGIWWKSFPIVLSGELTGRTRTLKAICRMMLTLSISFRELQPVPSSNTSYWLRIRCVFIGRNGQV